MPNFVTDLLPILLKVLISAGATLVILGVGVLLVVLLVKTLRVKADREHSIALVNTGNCQSKYYLWAELTEPELTFSFLYNQIPLAPVEELVEEKIEGDLEAVQAKSSKAKKLRKAGKKSGDAVKTGQAVAAKTGAAASLIGTLGSILPGKMGDGLKSQADAARDMQAKTAKATQAPKAAQRKMDSLKQSSGKLGVKADGNNTQGSSATVNGQDAFESDAQVEATSIEHRVKKFSESQRMAQSLCNLWKQAPEKRKRSR